MRYVECPESYYREQKSLFLAGGITGCPNWQSEIVRLLQHTDLVLLNPRRKNFDSTRKEIEEEQILWEFNHMKKANAISFWFPKETVCPITLYELGRQSALDKPLFVGVHLEYPRIRDVEIQMRLARPDVEIAYSLEELAKNIKKNIKFK